MPITDAVGINGQLPDSGPDTGASSGQLILGGVVLVAVLLLASWIRP